MNDKDHFICLRKSGSKIDIFVQVSEYSLYASFNQKKKKKISVELENLTLPQLFKWDREIEGQERGGMKTSQS